MGASSSSSWKVELLREKLHQGCAQRATGPGDTCQHRLTLEALAQLEGLRSPVKYAETKETGTLENNHRETVKQPV